MMQQSLLAIVVTAGLATSLVLQGHPVSEAGTTRGDADKGKGIYKRHCAYCHGPQGKADGYRILGVEPADLTARSTKRKSDAELLTAIHEGKPNMPVWKHLLSDQEILDVLAYVRTLAK